VTLAVQATPRAIPYQGLRSFNEEDADFFFGRNDERDVIIANLKASRLTVVYGPSGVGKTSLLRAGVAAELERQAGANLERLGTPEFVPVVFSAWRDAPGLRLAEAIAEAVTRCTGVAFTRPASLAETIASAAETTDATLLVILDQFEDLSLYHGARNGAGTFADQFPELVKDRRLPVNVLVSIREDALAQLDRFRAEVPWLLDTRLRVRPLTAAAAELAITGPLARYNESCPPGLRMSIEEEPDGGLVAAVLAQVRSGQVGFDHDDERGLAHAQDPMFEHLPEQIDTPYLQLVMVRIWEREVSEGSRVLRVSTLDVLGGAGEIVRTHLDGALGGLPVGQRELAADIFHHLVTPSGTKIAMRIPDLAAYSNRPVDQVQQLVERLESGQQRILRPVPPPPGEPGPPGAEIFHDVLAPAILAWRTAQSAERLKREKRQAEDRARQEHRRARIFRSVATAAVALLVVAIGAVVYAEWQRTQANHARGIAQSGALAAQALADFQGGTLGRGSLLSIEAYRTAPTAQARDELIHALEATSGMVAYFSGQAGVVSSVAFSPDGRTLASGSADGTVALWDTRSGRRVRTLRGHTNFVETVAFSSDGRRLAASGADGTVLVWRVATGQTLLRLVGDGRPLYGVAFSPTGTLLASTSASGLITLWNAGTGKRTRTLRNAGVVTSVAFNPRGNLLASGSSDHTVGLWDVETGRRLRTLRGQAGAVNDIAFSPDGKALASASADATIGLWNVATGRRTRTLIGHTAAVEAVAFSPDGSLLVSGSADDTVGVWDVARGRLVRMLRGHTQTVETVAFSPDGRTIASGGDDKSVILWNAAPAAPRVLNAGRQVFSVAFSPTGRRLASASNDEVIVWDLTSGRPALIVTNDVGVAEAVAFSPDGRTLAVGSQDGMVTVFNALTGELRLKLSAGANARTPLPGGPSFSAKAVYGVSFSPDGHTLAAASYGGALILWDTRTGRFVRALRVNGGSLSAVAFSPDGTMVAGAGANGTIYLWDPRSGRRLRELSAHAAAVEGLAFSADGARLASASDDQSVILWNPRTGQQLGDPLRGHLGYVTSVAFSPDGKTLASGSSDGTAIVWNLDTRLGQPLAGHTGQVTGVAFSPTGDTLATSSDDDTVALFSSPPTSRSPQPIYARLCGVVRRNLTTAEWREFLPGRPYQRVCPGYPRVN
jgi:WD40 repeat protein